LWRDDEDAWAAGETCGTFFLGERREDTGERIQDRGYRIEERR